MDEGGQEEEEEEEEEGKRRNGRESRSDPEVKRDKRGEMVRRHDRKAVTRSSRRDEDWRVEEDIPWGYLAQHFRRR